MVMMGEWWRSEAFLEGAVLGECLVGRRKLFLRGAEMAILQPQGGCITDFKAFAEFESASVVDAISLHLRGLVRGARNGSPGPTLTLKKPRNRQRGLVIHHGIQRQGD